MIRKLGEELFSMAFRKKGVDTFENACVWVNQLPYKRNKNIYSLFRVLDEECGTCSSKHELIYNLAVEIEVASCEKIECMFRMSAQNMPKVASVLDTYGLDYIPEAHTYLKIDGQIYDLTFPDNPPKHYLNDVIYAHEVKKGSVWDKKLNHKNFLEEWVKNEGLQFTLDEIWAIREECIEQLSMREG